MNRILATCLVTSLILASLSATEAQEFDDSESQRSVVAALQARILQNPSVFPLESPDGGVQSFIDGMRYPYFGYGERRYSHRTDFHPAFDVAYDPLETAKVTTILGDSKLVRAPQTYLKRVYAIQTGTLYSVHLNASGYKLVLKHKLQQPYHDSKGRPYHEYFTSYRHLDARSLVYLTLIARRLTGNEKATYKDLVGNHEFQAGEVISFVGFSPEETRTPPRSHLDFSLNLVEKPNTGQYIRDFAFNPLLLFPPFEYANPYEYEIDSNGNHAYQFAVDKDAVKPPGKRSDGIIPIEIHAGGVDSGGDFHARRYFVLNAVEIIVQNDGITIGSYLVDRHRKLGYDTSSYERLDNADKKRPHFWPPVDEQGDVFVVDAVVPAHWLKKLDYDWSKPGNLIVKISSIWSVLHDGHTTTVNIPIS